MLNEWHVIVLNHSTVCPGIYVLGKIVFMKKIVITEGAMAIVSTVKICRIFLLRVMLKDIWINQKYF